MKTTDPFSFTTINGRLILKTHDEKDDEPLAKVFSDPINMKHLQILCPPSGWKNGKGNWSKEDMRERVQVQTNLRMQGKSFVLNILLNEKGEEKLIGTTGYVRMDEEWGSLGIILDHKYQGKGLATEALFSCIELLFDSNGLGRKWLTIETSKDNEEMRGWSEKLCGLTGTFEAKTYNEVQWDEFKYKFTKEEWEDKIRDKLLKKINGLN